MIYIICALKPEAQAFVDKFKLQKSKIKNYTIFSNTKIVVIISGIGVRNTTLATQTLINYYDITDDDIYLNVGICGASLEYEIGQLLEINRISYKHYLIELQNSSEIDLTCLDIQMYEDKYKVVDMESYGFYDAVIHSPAIKKFYIFKVVSDHFEPDKITKDTTKKLIFNVIDQIIFRTGMRL